MTENKSCFNCKYFKERKLYTDGRENPQAFKTTFKKCGWEYMYYDATKEMREFFESIYCNNWKKGDDVND